MAFEVKDFYRGVIDGDGSLGFTSDGTPFLSLVTKSESLKLSYCKYIKNVLGVEKNVNRNKRDGVYNICLYRENAVLFAEHLYKDGGDLSIKRKYENYKKLILWVRTTQKINKIKWTSEMDYVVQHNSISSAAKSLGLKESSIMYRRKILKNKA